MNLPRGFVNFCMTVTEHKGVVLIGRHHTRDCSFYHGIFLVKGRFA